MDKQILEGIKNNLTAGLKEKFGFADEQVSALTAGAQNGLMQCLKDFVLKNGSKDIEAILLKQSAFSGSALESAVRKQLSGDLVSFQSLDSNKADEVAGFASGNIVNNLIDGFQSSTYTKDTDGICLFLGIDKNLLKMLNSPVGKMFGKFF